MSAEEELNQERRITFCLYEYWEKLAGNSGLPALKNMNRDEIAPFKKNLVLIDLRNGHSQPTFQVIGNNLQEDLENDLTSMPISDVPRRTMLSRITDHHLEVLANRVPIAFEAEFVNKIGENTLYRGILLPFSDDDNNINFILGGVRWILEKDVTLDDSKPTIEELMRTISDSNDNKPIEAHADQAIVDPIDANIGDQLASDLDPVIEQDDLNVDDEIEATPEHVETTDNLYPENTSETETGLVRKEFIPIEDAIVDDVEKTEASAYNEVHDEPEETSNVIEETNITLEDDLNEIEPEAETPVHNEVHVQPDEPEETSSAVEETDIASEDNLDEIAIDAEIELEPETPVHNEVHVQLDEPEETSSVVEETDITSEDNLDETTILDKIDQEAETPVHNEVHVQPDVPEEDTSVAEETGVTFESYLDETLATNEIDLETEHSIETEAQAQPNEQAEDANIPEETDHSLEETDDFFEVDITPSSEIDIVDEFAANIEPPTIKSLLESADDASEIVSNADDTEQQNQELYSYEVSLDAININPVEEDNLAHNEEILEAEEQVISPAEVEEPIAEEPIKIDNVHVLENIPNDDDLSIEELMQSIISERKFNIPDEHEEPKQGDGEKLEIESNKPESFSENIIEEPEKEPLEENALEENIIIEDESVVTEDNAFDEPAFVDDIATEAQIEEDNILEEALAAQEITEPESIAETAAPEITNMPKDKPKRTSVIERAMEMMSPNFSANKPVVEEAPQIVGNIEINEDESETPLQSKSSEDVIETPELVETVESPEVIIDPEIVETEVAEINTGETYIDEAAADPIEELVQELTSQPPLETHEVETEEDHEDDEFANSAPTVTELRANLKQIIGYIKKEDANHNRSRDSLYNILTAIYEFHDTCEKSPDAYSEIVEEYDLKIQSRAPFTPVLKICLGKDYDKTRLTEYAAALGIARYMNVEINEFHAFIKNFPGGIKGCVKEMRIIRKHGASGHITARKTRSVEEAREILREMAPIASFRLKKIIVGNNVDEFCLLLARRDGHEISVLKILDEKYSKIDPILKRAAFIKGNLNDRK